MKPIITKNQFYYDLGKAIQKHRIEANLSQRKLGKLINRHATRISILERGLVPIGLSIIEQIANILHLDICFSFKSKYAPQSPPARKTFQTIKNNIFNQVGYEIKKARLEANLTQAEIRKTFSVSNKGLIDLIEKGELPTTISALLKFANQLNLNLYFTLHKIVDKKRIAMIKEESNKLLIVKNYKDFTE